MEHAVQTILQIVFLVGFVSLYLLKVKVFNRYTNSNKKGNLRP